MSQPNLFSLTKEIELNHLSYMQFQSFIKNM